MKETGRPALCPSCDSYNIERPLANSWICRDCGFLFKDPLLGDVMKIVSRGDQWTVFILHNGKYFRAKEI